MKVTSSLLPYLLSISALCSLCLPSHSHALVLNGTGTATQLTGTLGTVDVALQAVAATVSARTAVAVRKSRFLIMVVPP